MKKTVNIEIDLVDVLNLLDEEALYEEICRDVRTSNPDWWVEKVSNPLKDEIKKLIEVDDYALLKESLKEMLYEKIEWYEIKDRLDEAVETTVNEIISNEVKNKVNVVLSKIIKGDS